MKEATKQVLDINQEPKTHEERVRLETEIEKTILKKLLPEYVGLRQAIQASEDDLAGELACLKAVRAGKGRDGEWTKYAEAKFPSISIRTMDRWIAKILEEAPSSLPEWVVKQLTSQRRGGGGSDKPKPIKMSLPLAFESTKERDLVQKALAQLGRAKLTQIILEAVEEASKELGL